MHLYLLKPVAIWSNLNLTDSIPHSHNCVFIMKSLCISRAEKTDSPWVHTSVQNGDLWHLIKIVKEDLENENNQKPRGNDINNSWRLRPVMVEEDFSNLALENEFSDLFSLMVIPEDNLILIKFRIFPTANNCKDICSVDHLCKTYTTSKRF